jgi:hypothetical protein
MIAKTLAPFRGGKTLRDHGGEDWEHAGPRHNAGMNRDKPPRQCDLPGQLPDQAAGAARALTGLLPDHPALYGVLAELEALGLEPIELRRRRSPRPGDSR